MKKNAITIGAFVIASAIIWGLVILGCATNLKGTECYSQIQTILGAGAGIHLIIIWGPLAMLINKPKKKE